MRVLKRIRAILLVAVIWGLVWLPVGLAEGSYRHLRQSPYHAYSLRDNLSSALVAWVVLGALSGASFAVILAIGERGSQLGGLTHRRMPGWGALGGIIPIMTAFAIFALGSWADTSVDRVFFIRLAVLALLGALT